MEMMLDGGGRGLVVKCQGGGGWVLVEMVVVEVVGCVYGRRGYMCLLIVDTSAGRCTELDHLLDMPDTTPVQLEWWRSWWWRWWWRWW